ncbi:MAG: hypothetical protein KUL85_02870 [Sphingobacterium mizutaii]|nr:hypothetical protein [Sphingobacterium mizutaii]
MKSHSIKIIAFSLFVFISCSKENNIPIQEDEEQYKFVSIAVDDKNDEFLVDELNADQIYPGRIFNLKSQQNGFDLDYFDAYKKQPISFSISQMNLAFENEKFESFKQFQDLMIENKDRAVKYLESTAGSGLYFNDFNMFKGYFVNVKERDLFYKEMLGYKDVKNSVFGFDKSLTVNPRMDLPDQNELILQSDYDKIKINNPDLYYVNWVYYGLVSYYVLQSDFPQAEFVNAYEKCVKDIKLSAQEMKVLDETRFVVYHRNSGMKETLIEKATGAEKINSLFKRWTKIKKESILELNYPLYFTAVKLGSFSKYFQEYKYDYMTKQLVVN